MKIFCVLLLLLFPVAYAGAQVNRDNVPVRKDSFKSLATPAQRPAPNTKKDSTAVSNRNPLQKIIPGVDSTKHNRPGIVQGAKDSEKPLVAARTFYRHLFISNPYFNFLGMPRRELTVEREEQGKDGLFYLMLGIVFSFALVKLLFSKYMDNLFSVFFGVSLKQKQLREQLLQSPLPSLLMNIFFIVSGGIYISFLMRYYNLIATSNLWYLMLYGTVALGAVYVVKFIVLKLMGWIFNITEATDTYIFIVFLVNKLLGILLIPFLILLAFSSTSSLPILITVSFSMIAIFFGYRYIISYAPVRKEIKVSQFHFVLYLCALEIIPLLLIYKVLLKLLERSS